MLESDSMRTQLITLASQLQKAVNLVRPQEQTSKRQRMAFFDRVVSGFVEMAPETASQIRHFPSSGVQIISLRKYKFGRRGKHEVIFRV